MVNVTGNTYPVKEQLKKLGARWSAEHKCWQVPDNKAHEARRLVETAPRENSVYKPQKCKKCGAAPSKKGEWDNGVKIRKDGICWDCATDS